MFGLALIHRVDAVEAISGAPRILRPAKPVTAKAKRSGSLFLVVALLLAGCLQSSEEPTRDGESNVVAPPELVRFTPNVDWSGCVALAGTASGPSELYPYPPEPPGWREPLLPGFNDHHITASLCDTVHWRTQFRGPVFVLFESFGGAWPPPLCEEGPGNRYSHLSTLWISDADLAAYLNATYGLPTIPAEFDVELNPAGVRTWQWGTAGQAKSEVMTLEVNTEPRVGSHWVERIFWYNQTTMSYIDVEQWYDLAEATQVGSGRMEPPMKVAATIQDYAATVASRLQASWSASVKSFKDPTCEQPSEQAPSTLGHSA